MLPDLKDCDAETLAVIEANLPERAQELVRIVGLDAAWKMLIDFGGTEIIFPKSGKNKFFSRLVELIGNENVQKLVFEFQNEEIYIPNCLLLAKILRNRQLIREWDELSKTVSGNVATTTIARRYFLSNRGVEKIVGGGVKLTYKPISGKK